jgi:hypothetical protein
VPILAYWLLTNGFAVSTTNSAPKTTENAAVAGSGVIPHIPLFYIPPTHLLFIKQPHKNQKTRKPKWSYFSWKKLKLL